MLLIKNKIRKSLKFILYIHLMVVFVCILTLNADAQIRDITPLNKYTVEADKYFKKAQQQKGSAIISLIVGGVITATGLIIRNGKEVPLWDGILLISGPAFILSSGIGFITAGYYKRKANVMLKNEKVLLNTKSNLKYLVSFGVKINL